MRTSTNVSPTSKMTPTSTKGNQPAQSRTAFFALVFEMSWQLAVVILGPILLGVWLDSVFNTISVFLVIGLLVAVVGSIVVMWGIVKKANRVPVPKLTAAQRRQIQEEYKKDDEDV